MRYDKAEFKAAYGTFGQLPDSDLPEIAFAGRSNVGKSSLLNRLFQRKNLARVSSVPGKTITINFYQVDDVNFVDLPGYGYAKVAKTEKGYIDVENGSNVSKLVGEKVKINQYDASEIVMGRLTEIINLAKNVANDLDIKFASVDIIETTNHELLVMEANSGVMMDNLSKNLAVGKTLAKDVYSKAIDEMFKEGE